MLAPTTKLPSLGAALPFPNTINTNYCFSADTGQFAERQFAEN